MASAAIDIIDNYFTCEFTTIARDGSPQTWPVSPRLLDDGRFLTATSIGLPQKAYNIRRNPRVAMLFSEPTGSGIAKPGAVLIQGDATADDRIVSDVSSEPELASLAQTLFTRQPAGALWSTPLGRRLWWSYYMRILIYVTPRRALYWPTRDFTSQPEELALNEVRRVG
ncbi:pyridoxamine 5'-phosphate oxidase family protein [Mycolicibacterium rufum]|uniref:Pyridoxamine 5'-phosphate oxidase family protein n=1 Tax=Mycolicibacterium rufum TaxID=318424 RepID=A0A9X2YBL8_9MYCO|nr:pyridoxamine 5'-phosphate oxidase family protein [Mycolicibacterium rufum]KGI69426.1 pyridoxamine 5'-phosphate oxidase [Mycolicibacterium rufum]MCV7070213.1 pyridoxamine 5'-phosphate oxidase family protein [Mycolicibacterium rufum]ULP35633.1 pyridoxamine 5'-phosphate oxidase family protein [Mycolicibacterium rufum]